VAGVHRVVEHAAKFESGDFFLDVGDIGLDGEQCVLVIFFLAHREQFTAVVEASLNGFKDKNDIFQ
jgi:hypothetical protein